MPNENKKSLSDYRLDKARQCLATAQNMIDSSDYASSANRSYYAFFHAIRAVLALDDLDFKKHSAVIAKFNELYVKERIFDSIYSKMIKDAFTVRGKSDYDDFYLVEKDEVEQQLANAGEFVDAVSRFLASRKQY